MSVMGKKVVTEDFISPRIKNAQSTENTIVQAKAALALACSWPKFVEQSCC